MGQMAGVFLFEFGQKSRLAGHSRFAANVLMGMPSMALFNNTIDAEKLFGLPELPLRAGLIITQGDSPVFPGQFRSHQTVLPLQFMKNPF